MRMQVNGILLLNKPEEMTSNTALQKVKRLFNAKKAGHTGSLDPIATGMLPICFGEATKFSQFLLDSNKTYRVVAKLGMKTTTGDSEGEVMVVKPVINLTEERIKTVMREFLGEIEQVPPMYSAVKYQGQPLYKLARRGISVERKSRKVTIFSLDFEKCEGDELTLHVHCSKGTYIRTLVEEIGERLDCGAHVIKLCRLSVSPYQNATMYSLSDLEELLAMQGQAGLHSCLLPIETAVRVFPAISLSSAATFYLRMGQSIRANVKIDSLLVRLMSDDARFLGIGEVTPDGRIKPHRLISTN